MKERMLEKKESKLRGLVPKLVEKPPEIKITRIETLDSTSTLKGFGVDVNKVGGEQVLTTKYIVEPPKDTPSIFSAKKNLARAIEDLS